ncbi:MAG: ROK family protein [Verrucomicrobiales bacterium]|nr:ROK family protein [Verrucomicrobiales bacterium]
MRPASYTVLGIDVGGTKVAAGLVELPSGQMLARRQIPTRPGRGGAALLEDIRWLVSELTAEPGPGVPPPSALGIGICELVSQDGEILSQNAIPWTAAEVQLQLKDLGPVVLEADVRAAARAESRLGAGGRFQSFLYVTIGTGISSCLVLAGQPYLGARGLTGTLASSPVTVPCGETDILTRRSLEELASGPALVRRFRDAGGDPVLTAPEVLEAAHAGDLTARRIVLTAAEALGSALGLLVNVLDPEAVILGGGLGLSTGLFSDTLDAAIRRHIWSPVNRGLPILRARTGPDAGILGAALAAASALAPETPGAPEIPPAGPS